MAATTNNDLCQEPGFRHKVSSVLNKSSEFASKHMFDGEADTCWNSDQGQQQYVFLDFGRPIKEQQLQLVIVFQGGFVGLDCLVEHGMVATEMKELCVLNNIQDTNDEQSFALNISNNNIGQEGEVEHLQSEALDKEIKNSDDAMRYIRLTFRSSSDFYGKMTIYSLQVFEAARN